MHAKLQFKAKNNQIDTVLKQLTRNFIDIESFTVSPPKLRRICVEQPLRTSHEDVQKSQTYQQFIRTMESEIRRLDTDSVYNHGK